MKQRKKQSTKRLNFTKILRRLPALTLAVIAIIALAQGENEINNLHKAHKKIKVYASQSSSWAQINNDQTYFYCDYACQIPKFILPKSYFVKVLEIGEESTRVAYMDGQIGLPEKVGFIKTCDLYLYSGAVSSPYPALTITLKSDEILFSDSKKEYPKAVLTANTTAHFYGFFSIDGEIFCYVYASSYVGYVRKSAFNAFELAPHEIPLITAPQPTPDIDSALAETTPDSSVISAKSIDSTMKIVIIIALSITCLSVVYLMFKPRPRASYEVADE